MGAWSISTVRLECRREYKAQVLELCRCAGVTGRPQMGENGYNIHRMMKIRDREWARDLSFSADGMHIGPEDLFALLNRLYGPVKLFYEWERGHSYSDYDHRLERLFDPAAMQVTEAEYECDFGNYGYLKGNGFALIREQIEAEAKAQGLPINWWMDEGELLPAQADIYADRTPEEEMFFSLCRQMGEEALAREDRTEPITETEPDPYAVTTVLQAAEQNGCTELAALLRKEFSL